MSNEQPVPILMYHSVSYKTPGPAFRPYVISPDLFFQHMELLSAREYHPITVTQFQRTCVDGGRSLPRRPVLLTFDDGYVDFVQHALPVLERFGFLATLFVPTAPIGKASRWLLPEDNHHQILNRAQLREICGRGIECGSHSHTHAKLDALPRASAVQEIRSSKEILEENLKQPVTSFAYPYGYYNRGLQNIVKEAGYLCACAVDNRMSSTGDNWFALARLPVLENTSVADLARKLTRPFSSVSRKVGQLAARVGRIRERLSEGLS